MLHWVRRQNSRPGGLAEGSLLPEQRHEAAKVFASHCPRPAQRPLGKLLWALPARPGRLPHAQRATGAGFVHDSKAGAVRPPARGLGLRPALCSRSVTAGRGRESPPSAGAKAETRSSPWRAPCCCFLPTMTQQLLWILLKEFTWTNLSLLKTVCVLNSFKSSELLYQSSPLRVMWKQPPFGWLPDPPPLSEACSSLTAPAVGGDRGDRQAAVPSPQLNESGWALEMKDGLSAARPRSTGGAGGQTGPPRRPWGRGLRREQRPAPTRGPPRGPGTAGERHTW